MTWIVNMLVDYFIAFGVLVLLCVIVTLVFFHGSVKDVSAIPIVLLPAIYAWVRVEIYHLPRETNKPK